MLGGMPQQGVGVQGDPSAGPAKPNLQARRPPSLYHSLLRLAGIAAWHVALIL